MILDLLGFDLRLVRPAGKDVRRADSGSVPDTLLARSVLVAVISRTEKVLVEYEHAG